MFFKNYLGVTAPFNNNCKNNWTVAIIHASNGVTSYKDPLCLLLLNIFIKSITSRLSKRNTQVTPVKNNKFN